MLKSSYENVQNNLDGYLEASSTSVGEFLNHKFMNISKFN